MILIGLTGGIGSGKSTASALLAAHGANVVDADVVTRQVQAPGQPVVAAIAERFGPGVLDPDGSLARQRLADVVFADPDQLAALNAIVHPAVIEEFTRQVRSFEATDDVVVLDVALLVENDLWPVQALVVVDVPLEIAVDRLVAQRGMRPDDAWARIASQAGREERLDRATRVLDNSGPPEALEPQVDELWAWAVTLDQLAAGAWTGPRI